MSINKIINIFSHTYLTYDYPRTSIGPWSHLVRLGDKFSKYFGNTYLLISSIMCSVQSFTATNYLLLYLTLHNITKYKLLLKN